MDISPSQAPPLHITCSTGTPGPPRSLCQCRCCFSIRECKTVLKGLLYTLTQCGAQTCRGRWGGGGSSNSSGRLTESDRS